jgi:hypothetical protein
VEVTYENIAKWFDAYYQDFNKSAGPLETVPNMEKYFAGELEFWPYNMPGTTQPSSREDLLLTMIHPGLHEELTPREYVIDMKRMVVVVRFQLQFNDEPSGRVWPAKQASCHYHLRLDKNKELKIFRIVYFTERASANEAASQQEMMALWARYRDKELKGRKNYPAKK